MLKKGNTTLTEQLVNIIKEEIEQGLYDVYGILPREIDYQKKYNISSMTVRVAMNELQNLGYIERIKGKGTFIKNKNIRSSFKNRELY